MNDPLTGGPIDPCEVYAIEPAPPPVWTTKDGRKLTLSEMTDDHLRNAARMLLRAAARENGLALEALVAVSWFNGEMAQYAVEGAADDHAKRADACVAWAEAMAGELRRRGVAP